MSYTAAQADAAWRQRITLVVEDATTQQTHKAEFVPVDMVRNGVTYIILYSMFATLLFVLLCAVLFKNGLSPQKRRLPFVWVLGVAMLGGLLGSTLNTVFWAYQLFGNVSENTMFRLWMSSTALLYLVPLVVHFAIQLRLLSFYPSTLASRKKRIAISILPSLMKIARITTISITLHNSAAAYRRFGFGLAVTGSANDTSNLFSLIFQLVDTVYASAFLLWRYWHLGRRDNELMQKKSSPVARWSKQLLFAIAFGYVLPTIYALALVIAKALDLSANDMGFMLVANVYVQAFGAVLASLSSAYKWRDERYTDELAPDNAVLPGMRNASDPFATGSTPTRDTRHLPALESVMSETGTSSRPAFFGSRFASRDARRHPASGLTSPASELSASGVPTIVTDGIGITGANGMQSGDVSPKSSALCHGASQNDYSTDAKRGALQYLNHLPTTGEDPTADHLPDAYPLPQNESRRSSDATLFAPSSSVDKLDKSAGRANLLGLEGNADSLAQSRPGSRPGTGGSGRIQRHGSGLSVPRDGSLREEEETASSNAHHA
ncbi:hypothetical protein PSEUBRA_000205 [Kalmanozyma brasiliensis GHG001]|uniref:Uncharacterized protein n=1 Tax=Kalmanozyma brasiliensis (strain GHG001) TaxID=1365824 RepID=V5F0I6_KALBG|nr:uncharacterized protein PSEUBRA_000205 [Kalmanozyma brasiliensis GHG001]EST09818.1 hypothetical protein PSEUBRA_000205 [Kalmanozyma brasiliensis GHG001]